MQPSTGPAGATAGRARRRGTSELWSVSLYEGRPTQLKGGLAPVTEAQHARGDAQGAADLNAAGLKRGGLAPKGVRGPGVHVLPPAGREEQLERWGVSASARWSEAERRPRYSDELDAHEYDAEGEGRELEELGFLLDGGWTAVETHRGSQGWTPGARDAGMTAHRGVLHPDEHVDADALRAAVEAELGFTYTDVHAVYRQGKKSDAQLELRERIDARLLGLARAGSNLTLLGRALGFPVKDNGNVRVLENALARARQKERA